LTVKPSPNIEITARTNDFCEQDSIILQVITNGDTFVWNTGSSENQITITNAGTYTATSYIGDCEKTATYTVEECPCGLWLPNMFTPNNDGINDGFIPIVHSTLNSFSMSVFDRWGSLIYKTDSYTPWDGTHNGKSAAAGVYFCVISYTCANEPSKVHNKQGSITLIR
jgi:gliding motility-associated-like protein